MYIICTYYFILLGMLMLGEAKLKIRIIRGAFRALKNENPYWRAFYANGFGELRDNYLQLHTVEVLFLLENKKAIVLDSNHEKIDFSDICKLVGEKNKDVWKLYLVYRDIRERGYHVKVRWEKLVPFEVYDRGKTPLQDQSFSLIFIAESGKELSLNELYRALEEAKKNSKMLIAALIDELGDVTYYRVDETLVEETILKIYKRR